MNRVLELPDNGNPRNRINGISVGDGSQFGGIAEGERMGRIFGYVAERIMRRRRRPTRPGTTRSRAATGAATGGR